MKQSALVLFCLFSFIVKGVLGNCNQNSPLGTTDCVLLNPYYSVKQWATCLTDAYIKQKSGFRNKKHQCRDRLATMCWYQCMLELNDIDQGPVFNNCSCGNSAKTTAASFSPEPTLSNWCYSPTGTSCNWYRDCLEKAHPCEGSETDYAIAYAEKFCNLYQEHYSRFSLNGQTWIDLVRKCLQVELVPLLRQWREVSCKTIRDTAFASHSQCYVNPDNTFLNKQSFCDLSVMDKWRVFWTIKSGFVQVPRASLNGLLETIQKCVEHLVLSTNDEYVRLVQFVINYTKTIVRQKRDSTDHNNYEFLTKFSQKISQKLSWEKSGIAWYAYLSNETESNTTDFMRVNILLASKRQLDLNSPNASIVHLNETVHKAAVSVEKGTLSLLDIGVTVTSFRGCQDVICNDTYAEVEAPVVVPSTSSISCIKSKMGIVLLLLAFVLLVLMY